MHLYVKVQKEQTHLISACSRLITAEFDWYNLCFLNCIGADLKNPNYTHMKEGV